MAKENNSLFVQPAFASHSQQTLRANNLYQPFQDENIAKVSEQLNIKLWRFYLLFLLAMIIDI